MAISVKRKRNLAAEGLARNRVLVNTCWLLALSLATTVLGAWIGVQCGDLVQMGRVKIGIGGLVGAIVLFFAMERTKETKAGVYVLLGFTFFIGLMMSLNLAGILEHGRGAMLVGYAFGATAAIFVLMACIATRIERDLSSMGYLLTAGLMVLLLAGVANLALGSSGLKLAILATTPVLFSACLIYDIKRILDGGETNFISATLQLYLDLANVFITILELLRMSSGEED